MALVYTNNRTHYISSLNIRMFHSKVKREAIEADRNGESMCNLGAISGIMKTILYDRYSSNGHAMANGFNFMHVYSKNRKLISYLIRCVYDAMQYYVRTQSMYNRVPSGILDTMHSASLDYISYTISVPKDVTGSISMHVGMNPVSSYKTDSIRILHNPISDEDSGCMIMVSSIHILHKSESLTYVGKKLLLPKYYAEDDPRRLYKKDKCISRQKEIKPFKVKLHRPLFLRKRTFKGIDYYSLRDYEE